MRDRLAIDGVVGEGERLIRKGGKVKFAQTIWQHDKLIPMIGQTVTVEAGDYWLTYVTVYMDNPGMKEICVISKESAYDAQQRVRSTPDSVNPADDTCA